MYCKRYVIMISQKLITSNEVFKVNKKILLLLLPLFIFSIAIAQTVNSPIHNYNYNDSNILLNLTSSDYYHCNYTLNSNIHNFTFNQSYAQYLPQSEIANSNNLLVECNGTFSDTKLFTVSTVSDSALSFNQILLLFLFIFGLLLALVYVKFR